MSKTLVIGSTGKVGSVVVDELVRKGAPVKAATRNPQEMEGREGVEPVHFDYASPATFDAALEDVSRIFMIGPATADPSEAMMAFLRKAGPQRKVVLMTAMNVEKQKGSPLELVEQGLKGSGAPYVILRPNWFMDNFHTFWVEPIVQAGVIPLPAGDAKSSLIDARDIGAAGAAAVLGDGFNGREFTLTGPDSLTYAEAAAVLTRVSGREIRYQPVDGEAFVAASVEAGAPEDLSRFLAMLFEDVSAGETAEVTGAVEELTGRPARGLEEYARDYREVWAVRQA